MPRGIIIALRMIMLAAIVAAVTSLSWTTAPPAPMQLATDGDVLRRFQYRILSPRGGPFQDFCRAAATPAPEASVTFTRGVWTITSDELGRWTYHQQTGTFSAEDETAEYVSKRC